MSYLSSFSTVFTITLFYFGLRLCTAMRENPRYLTLKGCQCERLECDCCTNLDFPNTPQHEVCLKVTLIPKEITLKATLNIDGTDIYTGMLDPSSAPICLPPVPTICFSVNHVDVQKRKVCSKLSFWLITLIKFPCVGIENGQLFIEPNSYV